MTKLNRNLSVKWRLIGFAFFLLILIIGTGLGGLNGMRSANQALSDVFEHQILPFEELREIDYLFHVGIIDTVDKALFEHIPMNEALKKIKESKRAMDEKWAYLDQLGYKHEGVMGNGWLAPGKKISTATDTVVTELISYFEKGDVNALDVFTDDKLYLLADEHRQTISLLIRDRLTAVKDTYTIAQENYSFSKKAFLLTIFLGILFSTLASYLLIKSIDVPLKKILNATQQVIRGDLTQRLDFGRHDEFGLLIKGFNQMVTYLSELVGQIQRSGIQVTSSITELAATNREQEVTANEHAATTSEIAASSTEIAATGAHLLATMKKVNSLTKNAAYVAAEGQSSLEGLDRTMVKMDNATDAIVKKLQTLNEKASNIADVVKTINKVADQTNLLSLNAAIEAEKAGEYGAGFAVVATEIRRLADQTAVATYDIAQMVKEVQSAISASVMGIDKFAEDAQASVKDVSLISEQLSGVIEQVEVIKPQVETLTEGIEAQTSGANQISESIGQLNEAAQQTAATLTQTSASISRLHQAALGLQESASRFKVEADNEDASSPI